MNEDPNTESPENPAILKFWQELRRRKVVRVAMVYMVTGWLIIQIAESTFEGFGIPDWAFRFVTLMVILGLPVALILAWALELTPDGIKVTRSVAPNELPADESRALAKKRNWTAYAFGALAPTLIFGSLAVFFYISPQGSDTERDGRAAHDGAGESARVAQSIAVLPLVNMSSIEENMYFAGGVHEDILTNLSRIDGLQVISRTSMLRYATSNMSLREIGRELGVDYIVEGSVRRIGNHVRVTIQLINAHNDMHLWANNYERELVDSFATQSTIAREISDSIHLELQPESVGTLEGMPTSSVKAYDLFIKAASLEKTEGETEGSVMRRLAMLEVATAEDPDFVEAWAVLKRTYDLQLDRLRRRGWYVNEGEDKEQVANDIRAKSQRALDKAISLDPTNPETLLARAVDHVWPKTRAEMQAQKAIFDQLIAMHPENAKAWYHLGHWHNHLDDFPDHDLESLEADAAAAFEEALRLDPFNARMVRAVLVWYRDRGYQEQVTRLSERLNQIIPETAADRSLARVSWNFRRNQIRSAFFATADETWFEEFRNGMQEAFESGEYIGVGLQYLNEAELSAYTNDKGKLIELSHQQVDLSESHWNPLVFSLLRILGMHIHTDNGELDQVRQLATEILEQKEIILAQNYADCFCYVGSVIYAHVALGQEDEARQLEDALVNQPYSNKVDTIIALASVDPERAVENAFAELAENPNWDGLDEIAAWYIWYRPFLAHPKAQAYYVEQGKWLDYLSTRVPEYAQYATGATSNQ